MFLQRSHRWSYDKKQVEENEQIAIVTLSNKGKNALVLHYTTWNIIEKYNSIYYLVRFRQRSTGLHANDERKIGITLEI